MVNTQLKILRVFGPTGAEVSSVLRGIRDDGCPGLRLLERDGEFAICVQVSAPNRAMAEQYCDKWAARLGALTCTQMANSPSRSSRRRPGQPSARA